MYTDLGDRGIHLRLQATEQSSLFKILNVYIAEGHIVLSMPNGGSFMYSLALQGHNLG